MGYDKEYQDDDYFISNNYGNERDDGESDDSFGLKSKYNDDYETSELEEAGLDPIDLEFMNEKERKVVLVNAGLNPDDFDFQTWI